MSVLMATLFAPPVNLNVRGNIVTRKENCRGCKILEPLSQPRGGVIEIGRHWLVNQYWGVEGFLGWLALQPREHCMQLEDLSEDAARDMGKVIKDVKTSLKSYWKKEWPQDRLDRLYVTYFFDSVFDNSPTEYHLHIHLIPRTRKMRSLISKGGSINCWEIYKIAKLDGFPEEYLRYEERVDKLINELKTMVTS